MNYLIKIITSFLFLIVFGFSVADDSVLQEEIENKKAEVVKVEKPKSVNNQFTCSGKRTCGEMNSCAEARFYLTQCGVSSLDRDKDGIPCESIC